MRPRCSTHEAHGFDHPINKGESFPDAQPTSAVRATFAHLHACSIQFGGCVVSRVALDLPWTCPSMAASTRTLSTMRSPKVRPGVFTSRTSRPCGIHERTSMELCVFTLRSASTPANPYVGSSSSKLLSLATFCHPPSSTTLPPECHLFTLESSQAASSRLSASSSPRRLGAAESTAPRLDCGRFSSPSSRAPSPSSRAAFYGSFSSKLLATL